jgi:hypothetical protein
LPEAGRVPVELGAERREQLLEGDVGVPGLGQRGGHPQRRGQVATDLELTLQSDQRARVAEDAHDHTTRHSAALRGQHPLARVVQTGEREFRRDLRAVRVQRRHVGRRAEQLA